MLDRQNGTQRPTDGAIKLILDVGKPGFDAAYSSYLRECADISDYMIASYRPGGNTEPQLLMSSSPELSTLYRAAFYKQDPNRPVMLDQPKDGMVFHFPSLLDSTHYSSIYRRAVFQSSGIIDKFGMASWNNGICYYINYYRMHGETPFSNRDRRQLIEVSELLSNLVTRHFEVRQEQAPPSTVFCEPNLEQIVRELSPQSPLTEREAQVCTLILTGCSSEAIALRLGIAVSSVLTYRRRAYERLSIVSQNELFARVLGKLSIAQVA